MDARYNNLDPKWTQYAEDVISGKILAGKYIILAAKRFLSWFDRSDIFFDAEKMEKVEDFIGHMKHFEGDFAGKQFLLLPFQRFILASIFAWYYVDDPGKRVVEEALLFLARKNAKTALSASIILADLCVANREQGYEGYLIAQTREQARIAYKFVKGYAKSL
jgi:phage terminase large subunit-like protein